MLSAEQYQSTVTYEAFQNMQAAVQIAQLSATAQQLQQQLGEAVKKIEQQQATIEGKEKALADISEYNEMTVEAMLAEVASWRAAKAAAPLPVLSDAVDTEGGAKD